MDRMPGMNSESFAGYLAGLDEGALTALLQARPDVRVEPVPRGFAQLAQRLGGESSLAEALRAVNRDLVVVGQAVAALGSSATISCLACLLGASEAAVRAALAELCGRGLAWTDAGVVYLPERLAAHWSVGIGGRPVSLIGRTVFADDLRKTAEALGVEVAGLRKPELIDQLTKTMSDSRAMVRILAELPKPARARLDEHRHAHAGYFPSYGRPGSTDPDQALAEAGLLLRVHNRWELPREVALAAWLAERELQLTGRPAIPRVDIEPAAQRSAAQGAVAATLHAMTTLLDEAREKPITALKKGGVGPRERTRLTTRLSLSADVLMLCIDLAHAAGLLGLVAAGYAPTGAYADWRAAEPSRQWATLATAWFKLEHAPTSREIQDGKELPPPLPLGSAAGQLRRALLIAVAGGESVSATGELIDWFFPLHGYDDTRRELKTAAAIREAELMGVVAGDRITECGQHLVTLACAAAEDMEDELARRAAPLLPEHPCTVILQSDLTAVVSGRPTVAVSRVLAAAAVSEARGTAGVWRFTPASVRGALDTGWTAEALLAELAAITHHALPQPLEYLITDVARRHGTVRVRGMRSCVLADETTIVELLHTRALGTLHLAQLAPTVLSSPFELDQVLSALRAAGLSPVAEDALGVVIVEERKEHQAPGTAATSSQARVTAAELAERLAADPHGKLDRDADSSTTFDLLALFGSHLDDAELRLLCHAVDNQHDVRIAYRDKNGSRTVRDIQPRQVYGRWLDSWCHLRNGQRDFAIANIMSVSPTG